MTEPNSDAESFAYWLRTARQDLAHATHYARQLGKADAVRKCRDMMRGCAWLLAGRPGPEPPPERCPGDDPKDLAPEVGGEETAT